jgi:hypothetical protein
MPDDL